MTTHSHTPESSSLITKIEWSKADKPTMTVHMKGGKSYTYYDVPESVYHLFIAAESVGKHFGKHIKGKYRAPEEKS